MATITEKINKNGTISFKAIVRYKGVFVTKTFSVKANRKKTVRNEVEDWARNIEIQIDNGVYRKEEKRQNYTVAKAIEKYISDGNPKKDESTRRKYIAALEWFKKEIGSLPIKTLERSDLKMCRNKLQKKHKEVPIKGKAGNGKITDEYISNSCVNRYLAYFSTFLSYCVNEYEIIKSNPMIGAKLKLKENDPRKRWLKKLDERQSLLEICKAKNYELYLCALLALTTGARKGEVLDLTWKNTDLENKAIYLLNTKNGDDRTVPIPDVLYPELKAFKEQYMEKKIKKIKNNYLFITSEGKPNANLIENVYPNVISKWKYEKITYHGLRHTYISIASLLGINTTIIKKIVGHKFDSVTGGYTHADCESLRKPMNIVANYMLYGKVKQKEDDNQAI
ncbi:MAG: site-specific integrase [Candidatus Gastranaerophilales bacterium]|nr:site-specific integrase [Candidatus Gastranaerophilales bacterium]